MEENTSWSNALAGVLGYYQYEGQLVLVDMGQVGFVDFSRLDAIGTFNLGACSVVALISPYAAILAHIPPLPGLTRSEPFAGDNNVRAMMAEVTGLYEAHAGYFPVAHSHIVCAVYNGTVGLPDQVTIMQEAFRGMGLEANVHYYDVPVDRTAVGYGTVVVVCESPAEAPSIYVQNNLVFQ